MDQVVTHSAAAKLTQIGSATALSSGLAGFLTENHIILTSFGVVVGIAVGITGICMQFGRGRREKREHEMRMDALRRDI